jgi:hypothetical protein
MGPLVITPLGLLALPEVRVQTFYNLVVHGVASSHVGLCPILESVSHKHIDVLDIVGNLELLLGRLYLWLLQTDASTYLAACLLLG